MWCYLAWLVIGSYLAYKAYRWIYPGKLWPQG